MKKLNKQDERPYTENDKTLMKETKDNECNDIPCSQIRRIYFTKMSTIFKDIYSFKTVPNRILMEYFSNEKKNLKIDLGHKRLQIPKAILRNQSKVRDITLLNSSYTTKLW